MANRGSNNPIDGQKYESLPSDPPPSYNEIVNTQPSAPSLNSAGAIGFEGIVTTPKPSAPNLEPVPYSDNFINAEQQRITNLPYNTTTIPIPAYAMKDEGVTYAGRRRQLPEDEDDQFCCDDDACEGCLYCMTFCNCIVQSCSLILQLISACSKN